MRRREFIALLGGTSVWPVTAWAQQSGKKPRIGTLGFLPISPSVAQAFEQGIAQLYSAKVVLEHRDAGGRPELFPERAADLIRLQVEVIFARGPDALAAAKNATTSVPVVAVDFESDPLAMGFVKNLARPGGNVTGVFLDLPEVSGKQMELLKEIFPRMTRVAIIGNPDINAPQFSATESAARAFSVQPENMKLRVWGDLDSALEAARAAQTDAGILLSSPLVFGELRQIAELALSKRRRTGAGRKPAPIRPCWPSARIACTR
jgi:ABC-type uncharacterized transport system substrate-binding protein